MRYLCYAYIKKFKCLEDIELNLDAQYIIKYDKKEKTLTVSKNDKFPENFWGENISSICGIVGDNGAGKSTAMSFLLNAIVKDSTWSSPHNFQGILVYKEDKNFSICASEDMKLANIIPISPHKTQCFYFSGHFSPSFNTDIRTTNYKGIYNASGIIRLISSRDEYYKKDPHHVPDNTLINFLRCHVSRINYRICRMLSDSKLRDIIQNYCLPKYIVLKRNFAGRNGLDADYYQGKREFDLSLLETPQLNEIPFLYSQEQFFSDFIYYNILNAIYEEIQDIDFALLQNWKSKTDFDILQKRHDKLNTNDSILNLFKNHIESLDIAENAKTYLRKIYVIAFEIQKNAKYYDNTTDGFFYFDVQDNFNWLIDIAQSDFFLTSKFFDFYYSNDLEKQTLLSSGEELFLDLFSTLYDALILQANKSDDVANILFFDEAEVAFHPEWQRCYLNLIIQFLNALKEIRKDLPKFQIIISTHSPLLLSDIPKCCVNFLQRENGVTQNMKDSVEETFATNVFNLYRNSFFMKNGLIGEFAKRKIEKIYAQIENEKNDNVLLSEIELIGDDGIKEYLIKKYQEKFPNDDTAKEKLLIYYKNKIAELEQKEDNHE